MDLKGIIEKHCTVKSEQEFTLSSGIKSNYYIDCKKLCLMSEALEIIVSIFKLKLQLIQHFDKIGGPSMGADAIVGGLTYAITQYPEWMGFNRKLNNFLIRPKPKEHGLTGRLIGEINKGDRIVLIDDVITTGKSLLDNIEFVESFGAKIVHVMCVVDRGGHKFIESKGYECFSILSL